MTPGRPDAAVVRRHLLAIDAALQQPWNVACSSARRTVHGLLESGLDDFVTFARHVNGYLDTLS